MRHGRRVVAVGGIGLLQVELDRIENAVDELRSFKRRKSPGDLKCLVDHYSVRRVFEKKLVNRKPKHVSVNYRHPFDAPMLRSGSYPIVDLLKILDRAVDQLVREIPEPCVEVGVAKFFPIIVGRKILTPANDIRAETHLQCAAARLTARP